MPKTSQLVGKKVTKKIKKMSRTFIIDHQVSKKCKKTVFM